MSRFVDKIAVEAEPGLTGKQLLLTNEDLKPVEPARREWRGRNFGKATHILITDPNAC